MGLYIDPRGTSKEAWLRHHGIQKLVAPTRFREGNYVAVCLVDNGMFSAAGICYSQEELTDFVRFDGRAKIWYYVPIEELAPFIDIQVIDELPENKEKSDDTTKTD